MFEQNSLIQPSVFNKCNEMALPGGAVYAKRGGCLSYVHRGLCLCHRFAAPRHGVSAHFGYICSRISHYDRIQGIPNALLPHASQGRAQRPALPAGVAAPPHRPPLPRPALHRHPSGRRPPNQHALHFGRRGQQHRRQLQCDRQQSAGARCLPHALASPFRPLHRRGGGPHGRLLLAPSLLPRLQSPLPGHPAGLSPRGARRPGRPGRGSSPTW